MQQAESKRLLDVLAKYSSHPEEGWLELCAAVEMVDSKQSYQVVKHCMDAELTPSSMVLYIGHITAALLSGHAECDDVCAAAYQDTAEIRWKLAKEDPRNEERQLTLLAAVCRMSRPSGRLVGRYRQTAEANLKLIDKQRGLSPAGSRVAAQLLSGLVPEAPLKIAAIAA